MGVLGTGFGNLDIGCLREASGESKDGVAHQGGGTGGGGRMV